MSTWWSRRDGRLLEVALGVALALVVAFGILLPLLGVAGVSEAMDTRAVETTALTRVPGSPAEEGLTLTGVRQAEVVLAAPDLGQRVLLALPEITGSGMLVLILVLLFRMARTLREGDVFLPVNARRLNVIALTVLAMGVLSPLVEVVTTSRLVTGTRVGDAVVLSYSLEFKVILLGLLVAALAEAFRRGARLRADTEGLV